jgi:hypothetical protein
MDKVKQHATQLPDQWCPKWDNVSEGVTVTDSYLDYKCGVVFMLDTLHFSSIQLAMAYTGRSHKSVMKISPNEPLPSKREIILGNWALGIHRSTYSSQSSRSLPASSLMFKSSGTPRSQDALPPFSFHEALIEASKFLVCPVGHNLKFLLM